MELDDIRRIQHALVRDPALQAKPIKDAEGKVIGRETYCNFGAQRIAHAFGCHDLDNKRANEIFDFLQDAVNWKEVDSKGAHGAACEGKLAVAVFHHEPHGHIVTIYPSPTMAHGEIWKEEVPYCANVGTKNEIGPVDEHFPHGRPRYFYLEK